MTLFSKPRNIRALPLIFAAGLCLSACASNSDRRGPPQDRQGTSERGERGPARSSGTFLHPISALFIEMDINKDKVTTFEELNSGTAEEWGQFSSKPSAINFSQWSVENLGSTDASPTFMSLDRDFNGVIAQTEFAAGLEREFKRLDKNRDNQLTRAEMVVAFAAPQGQRTGRGGQGGGRGGQGGGRGGQDGGRPPR